MFGYTYFLSQESRTWNFSLSLPAIQILNIIAPGEQVIARELQEKQGSAGVLQMGRQKKPLAEHQKGIQQTPLCTLATRQILQYLSLSTCQSCQGRQTWGELWMNPTLEIRLPWLGTKAPDVIQCHCPPRQVRDLSGGCMTWDNFATCPLTTEKEPWNESWMQTGQL